MWSRCFWPVSTSASCEASGPGQANAAYRAPQERPPSSPFLQGDLLTPPTQKTLDSPLDCKEIQPVHPKGNQS